MQRLIFLGNYLFLLRAAIIHPARDLQRLAQHSYRPFYSRSALCDVSRVSGGRLQQRLFLSLQISNLASPPHPIFLFFFALLFLFLFVVVTSFLSSLSVSLTSSLSHFLFIFFFHSSHLFPLPLSQNHIPFTASAASPSELQLLFPGCRSIPYHSRQLIRFAPPSPAFYCVLDAFVIFRLICGLQFFSRLPADFVFHAVGHAGLITPTFR